MKILALARHRLETVTQDGLVCARCGAVRRCVVIAHRPIYEWRTEGEWTRTNPLCKERR